VKNPPTNAGEVQVLSLVQEDPTCCGATKPVRYNYRSCALEPASKYDPWTSSISNISMFNRNPGFLDTPYTYKREPA